MGGGTRWIVIPHWERFQHRDAARTVVPAWIKVYTELLSNDDFLGLSFHLRGVLVGLWLEYARSKRQLRDSTLSLTRRLGHRVTVRDLESLNRAGFIEFSAGKPAGNLAGVPAGVEKRREERTTPTSDVVARSPARLRPEEGLSTSIGTELLAARLLSAVGTLDESRADFVRGAVGRLPESVTAGILERLRGAGGAPVRDRAGYVIGALARELRERGTA